MNQIHFEIDTHGAELKSLQFGDREYLWHGDPEFWGRSAPILFPIVGRLADDTLRIDGREYRMKQHGFARDVEFVRCDRRQTLLDGAYKILPEQERAMRFAMVRVDHQSVYPYSFDLAVNYIPQGNILVCEWQVTNRDDKTMYFQIGAHPAFMLPDYNAVEETHGYIQCYDANDKIVSPMVFNCLENGLRVHYGQPKMLINDNAILALTNTTFADDAILIEADQVAKVALFDKQGKRVLTVSCPQAEAFGLWAPFKPGCPFVCIEPWCGIADRVEFKGDISERDCIHSLAPEETFEFTYSIMING